MLFSCSKPAKSSLQTPPRTPPSLSFVFDPLAPLEHLHPCRKQSDRNAGQCRASRSCQLDPYTALRHLKGAKNKPKHAKRISNPPFLSDSRSWRCKEAGRSHRSALADMRGRDLCSPCELANTSGNVRHRFQPLCFAMRFDNMTDPRSYSISRFETQTFLVRVV